jgi:hypothetical protein
MKSRLFGHLRLFKKPVKRKSDPADIINCDDAPADFGAKEGLQHSTLPV